MSLQAISHRSQQIGRKILHVKPTSIPTKNSTMGMTNGATNGHVSAQKALSGKGSSLFLYDVQRAVC